MMQDVSANGAVTTLTVNLLYCLPFVLDRKVRITAAGFRITTGVAGGLLYWAIYDNIPDKVFPRNILLQDSVSGATANTNRISNFDRTFEPGLYWFVEGSNKAISTIYVDTNNQILISGWNEFVLGGSPGAAVRGYTIALADITLGLPDPFPIAATPDTARNSWPQGALFFDSYPA
jgi:hypothetical protein